MNGGERIRRLTEALPSPKADSMPHRRSPYKLVLSAAVAAALLPVAAAQAGTACSSAAPAPVFAPWSDTAQYIPFPGSSFEHGASGWSWGGKANIVSNAGNMALMAGSHAVNIPGAGTAKSPWLCVNAATPSMRFFVRRVSGTGNLRVQGVLNSPSGKISTIIMTLAADETWQPSPVLVFPPVFMAPLSATTGDLHAQFLFIADAGSVFMIDDVHLDPFKRT
jgi:hypothetical protein